MAFYWFLLERGGQLEEIPEEEFPRPGLQGADYIAAAISGRILHHSTTINIKGNFYPPKEKVETGLIRESEVEEI